MNLELENLLANKERVAVYFNLHKKLFSLQHKQKVVAHISPDTCLLLDDVSLTVGQAGRQRVLETKTKNVHARVRGRLSWVYPDVSDITLDVVDYVTYDPYKYNTFVLASSGEPIASAKTVAVYNNKIVLIN